jgi:hypothetical protein
VWKEEKRHKGAGGELDKVEMEDEEIVQKVQKEYDRDFIDMEDTL